MKKRLSIVLLIALCFLLTSCGVVKALKYTISGDIMDPVDGFSLGEGEGTLVYKDNKYILVHEISGACDIDITQEDILLGRRSNFPFFPDFYYHTSTDENPSFIMYGSLDIGRGVYLREDLYHNGVIYVLNDSSFEFDFTSAFVKTDRVNNDDLTGGACTKYATVDFYMKEIPIIRASKRIQLIDGVWYCVDIDVAYQLSEEFVCRLMEEGKID